jgi:hypothetical protein
MQMAADAIHARAQFGQCKPEPFGPDFDSNQEHPLIGPQVLWPFNFKLHHLLLMLNKQNQ